MLSLNLTIAQNFIDIFIYLFDPIRLVIGFAFLNPCLPLLNAESACLVLGHVRMVIRRLRLGKSERLGIVCQVAFGVICFWVKEHLVQLVVQVDVGHPFETVGLVSFGVVPAGCLPWCSTVSAPWGIVSVDLQRWLSIGTDFFLWAILACAEPLLFTLQRSLVVFESKYFEPGVVHLNLFSLVVTLNALIQIGWDLIQALNFHKGSSLSGTSVWVPAIEF